MSFLKFISATFSQSKPKSDPALLRLIREIKPRRILELGVGNGERSFEIIEAATDDGPVSYCGIDMFEANPREEEHLSLKDAYRKLIIPQCQVRLLPGTPESVLPNFANDLAGTELVVVSSTYADNVDTLGRFAARMLTDDSQIMLQSPDGNWQQLGQSSLPRPPKKREAA